MSDRIKALERVAEAARRYISFRSTDPHDIARGVLLRNRLCDALYVLSAPTEPCDVCGGAGVVSGAMDLMTGKPRPRPCPACNPEETQ